MFSQKCMQFQNMSKKIGTVRKIMKWVNNTLPQLKRNKRYRKLKLKQIKRSTIEQQQNNNDKKMKRKGAFIRSTRFDKWRPLSSGTCRREPIKLKSKLRGKLNSWRQAFYSRIVTMKISQVNKKYNQILNRILEWKNQTKRSIMQGHFTKVLGLIAAKQVLATIFFGLQLLLMFLTALVITVSFRTHDFSRRTSKL